MYVSDHLKSHYQSCCCCFFLVPPDVVPLDGDRVTVGIEEMSTSLHFRIDNAAPVVNISSGIRWLFSANFTDLPYDSGVTDITNLNTFNQGSSFSYSDNRESITISNISQSDEGRYFFMATNPAGVNYSHTDLIVHGRLLIALRSHRST